MTAKTTPTPHTILTLPTRALELDAPGVMGVLNATPDSFSDGGRHSDPARAAAEAVRMVEAGARVLDVGGESTRPGAPEVSAAEERERVLPVIDAVRLACPGVVISIDTRKASVARAALAAGAEIVNDVTALSDPDMAAVTAEAGAALILGHIQGEPGTMQRAPNYDCVVGEVRATLASARDEAIAAGVRPTSIAVDPGIGFGKTLSHNLELLARLDALLDLGPVVVGLSRKSMLGALLDQRPGGPRPVDERLAGGLGGAVWCALAGASLIRTHDVLATQDALRIALAISRTREGTHVA